MTAAEKIAKARELILKVASAEPGEVDQPAMTDTLIEALSLVTEALEEVAEYAGVPRDVEL